MEGSIRGRVVYAPAAATRSVRKALARPVLNRSHDPISGWTLGIRRNSITVRHSTRLGHVPLNWHQLGSRLGAKLPLLLPCSPTWDPKISHFAIMFDLESGSGVSHGGMPSQWNPRLNLDSKKNVAS